MAFVVSVSKAVVIRLFAIFLFSFWNTNSNPPPFMSSLALAWTAIARSGLHHRRIKTRSLLRLRMTSSMADKDKDASIIGKEDILVFDDLPYRGAQFKLDPRTTEGGSKESDSQWIEKLRKSLIFIKQKDYTSAWVHIPRERASIIESLPDFDLHHTNATENTIVMKQWLWPTEDKIPPFATHQVGCAGFCLNDKNEILVIREWRGTLNNRTATEQWKLPGGISDQGESFREASIREVFEETGIKSEFQSVLAFWHRHGLTFGKSDIYVVCLLNPTTLTLHIDPIEISDAKWMPLAEFMTFHNHPLIWHVLETAYGVGGEGQPGIDEVNRMTERLTPIAEIAEGSVQFGPDRPVYPTYTGRSNRNGNE